ncbi:MAG TPA: LPS export ABC transporter periplasmic protein LptC [Desulfobacteraceae bacterium]|jgi:LPS export ABC transporter protein LptC|nr:LPS export ABC transporter periplasmic protein LptC [Desulfobacteraceae bacterium]
MRAFFRRHWPLIGVAVVIVVAGFFFLHSLTGDGKLALLSGFVPGEGFKLNRIHYTNEDPEKGLRWVLDAGEVTFSEDKNYMVFKDFYLVVEPEGRPAITVKGSRGEYERPAGMITLTGDVKAETDEGYSILSDRLIVDEAKRTVSTDLPVTMSGPFFLVDGTGLFIDLHRETLDVHSLVTTKINIKAVEE